MKRIMIIDGGPRRNMNTAAMCEKFAEGARDAGVEVKIVRLYDLDYKGCRSCMACKLKNAHLPSCRFPDGLSDVLAECASADGLVMASPIYFGEVTAQLRAFFERLTFPWLSYSQGVFNAPKKMPVTMIYTMNGMPADGDNMRKNMQIFEWVLSSSMGSPVEAVVANNTMQVNNYVHYDFTPGTAENKLQWREEHWVEDQQKAYAAGKQMAEQVMG